jgi:hypothetical protein
MNYLNIDVQDLKTDQFKDFILEGVVYKIRLRWNPRGNSWGLTFYDPLKFNKNQESNTQAAILGEKKLMPMVNFFKQIKNNNLPRGYLTLYDTQITKWEDFKMPSIDDIGEGQRFVLIYFTEAEKIKYSME